MAHILPPRKGKRGTTYPAQIELLGVRKSITARSARERDALVAQLETEIRAGARGEVPNKTFADLLDRYKTEVSAHKRGYAKEALRLDAVKRDPVGKTALRALSTAHLGDWVAKRLKEVKPASVQRDLNILNHACQVAWKSWKWLKSNPCADVIRPKATKPRTRVMSDEEWKKLNEAAVTDYHKKVLRVAGFALETAMRAGEILALRDTDITGNVAHLKETKNGHERDVPLSNKALELFGDWGLNSAQLDVHWRGLCEKAGIKDLHFHDTRRTAISRLAQIPGMNPMRLAKMTGHRDLKMLLNTYFADDAAETAKLLNPAPNQPDIGPGVAQERQTKPVLTLVKVVNGSNQV